VRRFRLPLLLLAGALALVLVLTLGMTVVEIAGGVPVAAVVNDHVGPVTV